MTHSDPVEAANVLGRTFAKVSATDSYGRDFVAIKNHAERTHLRFTARSSFPYNAEITIFELKTALAQTHDTSAGADGITYNMLHY